MKVNRAMDIWNRLRESEAVTVQEESSLREWLSSLENRKTFHSQLLLEGELNELLREMPSGTTEQRKEELVTSRIDTENPLLNITPYRFPWKAVVGLAALLVLSLSLSYLGDLFKPQSKSTVGKVVLVDGNPKVSRGALEWSIPSSLEFKAGDRLVTGYGEELELQLTDGTYLWLGPLSSLHIPDDFTLNQKLALESGSLHLDVSQQEKPFSVGMGRMEVEVLGTRFFLRHQPQQQTESVHLQEGKVRAVIKGGDSHLLNPGEELLIHGGVPSRLRKKAPYTFLDGVVQDASESRITLKDAKGDLQSLRVQQGEMDQDHLPTLSSLPNPGQKVRVQYIDGPSRVVDWEIQNTNHGDLQP